jgi:hypothetical protein
MGENWNLLLKSSKGKYIAFLGDDDALIPTELLKLEKFADSCNEDIIWTNHAGFGWPINEKGGNYFQVINRNLSKMPLDLLQHKVLRLRQNVDLPLPYSRVLFHRRILDEFDKTRTGENFCSRIPDISAAVKIALLSKTQINFGRTVFISGASRSSSGRLGINRSLKNGSFDFNNLQFNPLPKDVFPNLNEPPPFGYINWYEAYITSINSLNFKSNTSLRLTAFKCTYYTRDLKKQKDISNKLFKNYNYTVSLAYFLSFFFYKVHSYLIKQYNFYIKLMLGLISKRLSMIVVYGKCLDNTLSLIKYIENNSFLNTQKRVTKINLD